ncbi:hypothetical protein HC026_11705 [Lactobacillus sp. LC28-10]|uniref:Uncharacterized protein n=1 Tax=Secundilactobacillus angelensis TaxID=2722706 RepID=A0ABX1L2A4_9LACO|nr:hypothetical protein [Secundilactobacillus angelensis]MCH5462784.1 hypothetical protein [Secundilactobacillus angelensis]NLR19554.1 hypothetical protein [Secundilactobacillus angelensis]
MSYYWCAIFTLISAVVSAGFSTEAYFNARALSKDALTTAKYAASRSAALVIVAVGLIIWPLKPYLVALATVMIFVQLFDGLIGIKVSLFKTLGPLLTALVNVILLLLYLKS